MKDDLENEQEPNDSSQLAVIESLSEPAIRRRILADAVQHPATVLSGAAFTATGVYLLVLAPVFGGARPAMVLLGVFGVAVAASFVWRYVFRYSEEYAEKARELMKVLEKDRARSEEARAKRLRQVLQEGFFDIGAGEGVKALGRLVNEYERLQPVLLRQADSDPLSMSRVPVLTGATYRRGLSALSDALELLEAGLTPGREVLLAEIAEMEENVEASRRNGGGADRLRLTEDRLASHRERLEMLDQLQLRADQLLFQASRCEALLHRARIELTAFRTGSSESSVDSVVRALEGTIVQVKEVQAELRRLGY
ncbi:MAG: hypothetical protein O3A47_08100 [Chloroflexi bacterium]|nr:hypothetical protein [Chloroflexota bacterium]